MNGVRVGTSGWSYVHWDGAFYPEGTSQKMRLGHYMTRFSAVEINATFYRLPSEKAVLAWRDAGRSADSAHWGSSARESDTDGAFLFAVKGSRLITHYRRLQEVDEAASAFIQRARLLDETLGVVLWQLPASMRRDAGVLDAFLTLLDSLPVASQESGSSDRRESPRIRHAVEFRHASWLAEETFAVLRAHDVAHVHVSSSAMPEDLTVTTDFVYVRFHGLTDYAHDYNRKQLEPWAEFLRAQYESGHGGYVFFNNDARARAPANASVLIELLGEAAYPAGRTRREAASSR